MSDKHQGNKLDERVEHNPDEPDARFYRESVRARAAAMTKQVKLGEMSVEAMTTELPKMIEELNDIRTTSRNKSAIRKLLIQLAVSNNVTIPVADKIDRLEQNKPTDNNKSEFTILAASFDDK